MQKFVDKIAEHLLKSDTPLDKWVIILPSERAKQYIQKALFEKIQKPFFAPKMLTINTWISELSPKTIIDKTHLLLELYDIHKNYPAQTIDTSFDEFLSWGRMLMSDFDEIERYLVDSNLLFRNLKDIKEIENWSFNSTEELSENQQKYLEFWDRLGSYFIQLQQNLSRKNMTLMGSVYRQVAENTPLFFTDDSIRYLFAGFNALSKAEMTLFKNLVEAKQADILFDSDNYYLKDNLHEAGYFIRKFQQFMQTKELPSVQNTLLNEAKKIEVISCSQLTGQVKVAQTLLAQLPENEFSETLVLLADESLIIPLLQNIPKTVKQANITLGLPLSSTALLTWVELIFNIQEGYQRYQRKGIYYKDLLAIWNHPFYNEILEDSDRSKIVKKEQEIQAKNIIYQSLKSVQISEKSDALLEVLFTPWENSWSKALQCIRKLNNLLYSGFDVNKEENKLEKAVIQCFDASLVDFQNCVETIFPEMNLRSFRTLFNQEWMSSSISYFGNPIEGIQIMGLLETRLLDFKNIIILGLNEGKMPPANAINSLIPMDLRRFVDMPLMRDKQGLFAHHFYRLFHYAQNIYITYHNGVDSSSFAEKSRFIAQLEMELAQANPKVKITHKDYTLEAANDKTLTKRVAKTPAILQQIDSLFANGVSASMLKKYITCPLDFYYQYVLKFGEEKKVEEELESNTFGTLIHAVLEDLYEPFNRSKNPKASNVTAMDVEAMLRAYERKLFEQFKAHFNGDEEAFLSGKNFLSYAMSKEMCRHFLESELKFLKENPTQLLFIEALEEQVIHEFEVPIFDENKTIKLKGFIDRVDSIEDKIRILDYKTGKVNPKDVADPKPKFAGTDLEYLIKVSKDVKHFFQLYTYFFLYHKATGKTAHYSGIISFINRSKNPYLMQAKELTSQELIDFYPTVLQNLLEEIYDTSTVFEHNPKAKYCAYC